MNKYGWLLFAALCGALVGLRLEQKNERTLWQRFTFVLCGLAFAFFLTPLITSHWHLTDVGQISAIGFVMAMMWQNIYNRFARGVEDAKLPFEKERDNTREVLEAMERMQKERKEGDE